MSDELVAIDGVSVSQLYESRRPRFLTRADPVADEWALSSAVAGRHNSRYEFLIRRAGRESVLTPSGTTPARNDVEWKRVGSNIGLIAIRRSRIVMWCLPSIARWRHFGTHRG